GMQSDAQIFNNSELKERLEDATLGLPPPEALPGQEGEEPVAYHILGDDAFALKPYLMKPYAKRNLTRAERIFNYRLSRGRRVVENAFGILANRFPCLLRTMPQLPETVESIVRACICLHNLMRTEYPTMQERNMDQEDEDHNIRPGAWRNGDAQLLDGEPGARRGPEGLQAKRQRDRLRDFVNGAGAVPWQERMVV
ncbi:MAG: transposase family protein, partial [Planctomycetes bacterium]|nr:transposase family protein [Planctomycetota bacterium]